MPPDTLPADLQSQIDSLVSKTNVIFKYVSEQDMDPKLHPSFWGICLLFLIITAFILFILFGIKNKIKWAGSVLKFLGFENDKEHIKYIWHNYIGVGCWILIVGAFFAFGLIHTKAFPFSQADLLFTIALIFTIVGAFWSVFSRIESTKAFKQSEKTYNALGSTFDFSSLFDQKKLPEIYGRIGKPKTEVSLYIGFPIVGLPYDQRTKLKTPPESLFGDLMAEIGRTQGKYKTKQLVNWTINIGVFQRNVSLDILDAIPNIDDSIKNTLKDQLTMFYDDYVEYFKNKKESDRDYAGVRFIEIAPKEKFRFVTIKERDSEEKQRTFVWVVNFKNGGIGTFDSWVFQTEENKFLDILEDIFEPLQNGKSNEIAKEQEQKEVNVPASTQENAQQKGKRGRQAKK